MDVCGRFNRDIAVLPEVFDLVGRFFVSQGIDPQLRTTVDFALEEVFTNFVKYNPEGKGGIAISLQIAAGELVASLTDFDSDDFDLREHAPQVDTSLPLQARRPGGLGVHLVKKLMDRIEYAHEARVSTVRLYKTLS